MSDRRRLRSSSAAVPIFRIVSLLFMLAVIGLTVYNLHERSRVGNPRGTEEVAEKSPASGENLSRQPPPSPSTAAPKKNRKPIADQDPELWEQFRRRSEAILDKTTSIHSYEMPAYWRVMDWVQSQSLADFQGRSLPEVPFQNFIQHPGKYRGRPVRVELNVQKVLSIDLDDTGNGSRPKKLYELWGLPTELDGYYYVVVTPELPRGFPVGKQVDVTTTVYGYFFKLQGYIPFDAKPDARPLLAPLIIGRVAPVSVVAVSPPWNPMSNIVLLVGGGILVVVIIGWIIVGLRKPVSPPVGSFGLPDTMDDNIGDNDAMNGDAGVDDE